MGSKRVIWREQRARVLGLALGAGALVALTAALTLTAGTPVAGQAANRQAAVRQAAVRQAAVTHSAARASATNANSPGFWYGTDSDYIAVTGRAPYREPVIGSGAYGGYVGMTGNWASWQGCHGQVVWSPTDANDARTNYVTYHRGIGVAAYWFMAGPGVDPHYNGTTTEAKTWGQHQAAQALLDLAKTSPRVTYPVLFMDVELPGNAPSFTPAPDNGWRDVYTSACSGLVHSRGIAAAVDRADFNGFADYLTSHSSYKAGVYSAPSVWRDIFGTGADAAIPNIYEWTYTAASSSLANHPYNWCLAGTQTCAHFFGGQTSNSAHALMWQWSGGGGVRNGYGDFDQIDKLRMP